ncbi:carbamoyl phosphate synthase-like protein [Corynebacterium occultum]|uniref:Carbamoyl phosphate synthase-like protein n=1 Tax=Corynebacterium occultum TaxID=2675219 RepID=A0A6B8W5M3_9CORY|nr:ATP-grasp domain-containing protein [Corynebacterium occultum]QGU07267.1 carbamoyl phosphate synthase-like protein [Corynebacterium occultum]
MNILLSSVGRRPYLVRWFQEALLANGLEGRVIAADLDPLSPASAFTADFLVAPRVDDPAYPGWLNRVLQEWEVDLAVSINDFELSEWARLPNAEQWRSLVRFNSDTQNLIEDKYAMAAVLDQHGILNPLTWLGNQPPALGWENGEYVTKGRFGSASRGLRFTSATDLYEAITSATGEVTTRQGKPALGQRKEEPRSLVIVQEMIHGVEYGLDVVCDLQGEFSGVLARRKIAMRAGETDRAESVDGIQFEALARQLAEAVPHPGTMDVDVIVDAAGQCHVIDINPRFGGGYPFSHLAGARIPDAYVAWAAGLEPPARCLESNHGVVGGKMVEAVRIS